MANNTNRNANEHLIRAIQALAESLPARVQIRSLAIAVALREINHALDIQPHIRGRVEYLNHARDCLAKENSQ